MGCSSSSAKHQLTAPEDQNVEQDVFLMVNGTSGGNASKQLLNLGTNKFEFRTKQGKYCAVWIFDLRDSSSRGKGFEQISLQAKLPGRSTNIRVVACGGDGTVKWVISELVKIKCLHLPIGVIPFGTGNDFSRALGWGATAPSPLVGKHFKYLKERVQMFLDSDIGVMDCWNCDISLEDSENSHLREVKDGVIKETHLGQKMITHEMINYLSFGFDAQIMFEFEQQRTKSQLGNKLVMARKGLGQAIVRPPRLKTMLKELSSGDKIIKTRKKDRLLLFSNIPSYSAGANPWRRKKDDKNVNGSKKGYHPQFVGDKTLECLTVHSSVDIGLNIGTGGASKGGIRRTAQEKSYDMEFVEGSTIYLQVDGEAMKCERVSSISIRHGYHINVLRNKSSIANSLPKGYRASMDRNIVEAVDEDFADSEGEEEIEEVDSISDDEGETIPKEVEHRVDEPVEIEQ